MSVIKVKNMIKYKYSIRTPSQAVVWERDPCREIILKAPELYDSKNMRNHIVNGCLRLQDGHFGEPQFIITQVSNTRIFMGRLPQTKEDLAILKQHNFAAAINLMDDELFKDA